MNRLRPPIYGRIFTCCPRPPDIFSPFPSKGKHYEFKTMALRLGDTAPNFTADTSEGRIDFHQWLGNSWGIFFSHPKDYTPVCTTELGTVAKMKAEFDKRNVKCIHISVDPVDSHKACISDFKETQNPHLNHPILCYPDKKVRRFHPMIHPYY